MFTRGPVVRKRVIISDDFEFEVRARWHFLAATHEGVTKIILSKRLRRKKHEFSAIWAFSDGPVKRLERFGLHDALEDAEREARWAVRAFCHYLSMALRRETASLQDELLLHFRVYRGLESRDSWELLSGFELAGEWAKIVKLAYIFLRSEIALRCPVDYEEFEQLIGEKLEVFGEGDEAELDLRPILQAKSLAELVLPKGGE